MNHHEDRRDNTSDLLPNVLVLWACGMVSGSIGATTVYPLNLIRTRSVHAAVAVRLCMLM